MREFKINDYSLFSSTADTVTSSIGELNRILDEMQTLMNELHSDEVFKGPISDSCYSGWQTIYSALQASVNELTKAALFLNTSSTIYKMSDSSNASNIGSV